MSEKLGEVFVEIAAKADKINATFNEIRAKSEATAKNIESTFARTRANFDAKPLLQSIGSISVALFALNFAKRSLEDWSQQEKASNRLAQALQNAGVAAKDLKAVQKDMEDFSTSMMKSTAFGDEVVTEVQAMFVMMTKLTGSAVKPLTQATLDLAVGLGMDAESAAKLVSKAIEGGNVLGRYGIQLSDTGTKSERVAMVTQALEDKFAGLARGELNTTSGKLKQLSNGMGELRESFGKFIAEALNPMIPGLLRFIDVAGKVISTVVLPLQRYFAELYAGVATFTLAVNAVLPQKLKILSDQSENFLKNFVAKGLTIAANAKKEFDTIWSASTPPASGASGLPVVTGGKATIDKDILKQRLDALREVFAAEGKLAEQQQEDQFLREQEAINNRKALRLKEIDDMAKTATTEKPVDAQALNSLRLAVAIEAEAAQEELARKLTKFYESELEKRAEFSAAHDNDLKAFNRNLIDQQIRNYALSTKEFKAHLDDQLELEIQSLEERNRKIKEYNAKNPENQLDLFDIGKYRSQGRRENELQTGQYAEGKKQYTIDEWKRNNRQMADSIEGAMSDIEGHWAGALDQMFRGNQNLGQNLTALWTGIADSVINQIERIIARMLAVAAFDFIVGIFSGGSAAGTVVSEAINSAHGGGRFAGTSTGIKKLAAGGSFIVPKGYSNDTFPLMVESGERVTVTPSNMVQQQGADYSAMLNELRIIKMNLATQKHSVSGSVLVDVQSKTDGQDIYAVNKKAGRVRARIK